MEEVKLKKVSIIIPVYNSEKYIKKCLNSVINQTYKNLEIIVIDDESSDNSKKICEEYLKIDNRIKFISKKNGGVSSTRNMGIKYATGSYLFFLDSDDWIDCNAIENMMKYSSQYDFIAMNYKIVNEDASVENVFYYEKILSSEQYINSILNNKIGGQCWGILINKNILENIMFDCNTKYMEDTLFIAQVLTKVKNVKIIDNIFYYYFVNNNSATMSNFINTIEKISNYIYSIDKIQNILEKSSIKVNNELYNNKKMLLIKQEILRVPDNKRVKEIIIDEKFKKIINNIDYNKIKFKYKIYLYCLKKNYFMIILFLKWFRLKGVKIKRKIKKYIIDIRKMINVNKKVDEF